MKKIIFGLLFSFGFLTISVSAQIMSNPAQWYINNQIYSTRVFNGVVANSMLRRKNTSGGKQTRQNQPKTTTTKQTNQTTTKTTANYTLFKASPANILPKQLAGKSSGNQRETEQLLEAFVNLYKQTAQKDGFPPNDLAYAFQYFVVNNYQIYHNLVEMPAEKDPQLKRAKDSLERFQILEERKLLQISMSQERTVYNQFREVLAANADVQKMTDAQKQEASELLAIMFGVNYAGYAKGVNDGDDQMVEQARALAKQGLEKLLGVPVSRITINEGGLEL